MAENYNVSITLTANDKTGNAVGQINREMETLKTNAETAGGSFEGMGGIIEGAFAGITLGGFSQFVGDLANAGREAMIAESTFSQLTEPIGGLNDVLGTLRTSTNFTITDTALEQIGSKALLTGVAGTKEELGQLVEVGSRLGTAMGDTAAGGVETLNAAILNMSFQRLDNIGISSARVRERMQELLATGQAVGNEEAFKMAVLEEGAKAVDHLGKASIATTGALPQLITQLGNLKDQAGAFVLGGLEAGAQIVVILQKQGAAQTSALQSSIDAQQSAADIMTNLWNTTSTQILMHQSLIGGDLQTSTEDALGFFQELNTAALMFTQEMGRAPATVEELTSQYIKLNGQNVILTKSEEDAIRLFVNYRDIVTEQARISQNEMRGAATAAQMWRGEMSNIAASSQQISQTLADAAARAQYEGPLGDMTMAEQQLNNIVGAAKSFNGVEIIAPDQMGRVETLRDTFQQAYDRATELHDKGILPDDLFNNLKDWKTEQDGLLKQTQDMAKNYQDIAGNLDKILGVTNGGLGGQIEDRVLEYMKAHGFSDKQMQAYQGAADMQTGRNTLANQMFEQNVLPQIAAITKGSGAENAAQATIRAEETLQKLVAQGATPEQIQQAIRDGVVTGFRDLGGGKYEALPGTGGYSGALDTSGIWGSLIGPRRMNTHAVPNAGGYMPWGALDAAPFGTYPGQYGALPMQQTPTIGPNNPAMIGPQGADFSQMATQTGQISTNALSTRDAWLTINGYVDTTRTNLATMADNSAPALATSAGDIATQMGTAQEKSQKMSDLITGLTKTKQVVNVELRVTDPSGLLKYAAGLDQKGLAKVVNANGGVTPGSDGRRN